MSRSYWLINPNSEGVGTDLSEESLQFVRMGWNAPECPKFYEEVKSGDIIIVTEGSHKNSNTHYIGIADRLEGKCWYLKYSTTALNDEISQKIRGNPQDFSGGESKNPWGATKSIIMLGDNPTEQNIKQTLSIYFMKIQMKENIDNYINLLKSNHNLILTGAPGTGKTYLAKEISKAMDAEVGFVQFHPSYDYTDFVEGLRPINDDSGAVVFERRDGVFKEFCKRAIDCKKNNNIDSFETSWDSLISDVRTNLSENKLTKIGNWEYGLSKNDSLKYSSPNSPSQYSFTINKKNIYDTYRGVQARPSGAYQKDMQAIVDYLKSHYSLKNFDANASNSKTQNAKPFVFIIDEINRGEISKIFGELFFSIDPGYRGESGRVSTQYQNMIDEGDAFKQGFFVPENVYIIGTMNDIDRSVESMDFAFRRRFAFAEIKAAENVGMLDKLGDDLKVQIISRMNNLNAAIEKVEGLSSAYHIGASYFLKLQNYDNDFDKLWQYHIEGLLREYLRGMQDVEDKIAKLKSAYDNESDSNNGQQQ
ncbi:MAG: AAA family ATPase [Bacteroidales bacterium]|nr:AAA family ATPase [Bacteroidales bacterium]